MQVHWGNLLPTNTTKTKESTMSALPAAPAGGAPAGRPAAGGAPAGGAPAGGAPAGGAPAGGAPAGARMSRGWIIPMIIVGVIAVLGAILSGVGLGKIGGVKDDVS